MKAAVFHVLLVGLNLLDLVSKFLTPVTILLVVEWMLPVRRKRWARPLLYIGCWIFEGTAIYIGDPVNLPGALLALFLAVFLCCEGTGLQRFSVTLILASLGLSLSALTDNYLRFGFSIYMFSMRWDLIRLFSWFLVYLALRRFAPRQEYSLPPLLWALVDVLTLTPFAATLVTVLLSSDLDRPSDNIQGVLLLSVVTFSSFGLLWAVVVLARQQKLEQEKSFFEMNRLYYRNLEQEQFQVRRLRHDMANHLQTMSGLREAELHEYISGLIRSPAMEHMRRFCENSVVNIVMASKETVMEQDGIRAEIEVSVPRELPVRDEDLCAVFANSLDNAIEACEKLPEDQRELSVRARTDKGLFVLQVQNPFYGKTVQKDGVPVTTKQNTKAHGFGIAGIREMAARYGGSMEITERDGQFTLLVYFPLDDQRG
jgi:Signal transduction histidine kinase regulating citrate/malate metabolism